VLLDISSFEKETRFMIKAQNFINKKDITKDYVKKEVLDLGFIRFSLNNEIYTVNDEFIVDEKKLYNLDIIIDRLTVKDYSDEESSDTKRLKDSLDLAFKTGN
jgi:excinuclease UvrABC ATPase subunit